MKNEKSSLYTLQYMLFLNIFILKWTNNNINNLWLAWELSQNCLFFNVKNTQTSSGITENTTTLNYELQSDVMCFYQYFWCLLTETSGSYFSSYLNICHHSI